METNIIILIIIIAISIFSSGYGAFYLTKLYLDFKEEEIEEEDEQIDDETPYTVENVFELKELYIFCIIATIIFWIMFSIMSMSAKLKDVGKVMRYTSLVSVLVMIFTVFTVNYIKMYMKLPIDKIYLFSYLTIGCALFLLLILSLDQLENIQKNIAKTNE